MITSLTPAQSSIASDTHRFRVILAGRRFGKTTLSAWEMFAKAVSTDDCRVAYIAPTYQQARDIAWNELKKVCGESATNINESRLEITIKNRFEGSSYISLRGWESIETLRGQKYDLLVLDEVATMRNFWSNWQEVIRPALTDRIGHAMFIGTPKGFNHFYDLYGMESKDNAFKSFHFTSYDNPHLPFEELEKAKQEVTPDRFAQEYLADFRKTEGLVYKGFDRTKHVYTEAAINEVDRLAGIDWGWTNPAASHLIQKDTDRHYWISNEFYKTNKTTLEIVEHVKSLRPNKVYPDPAEPDRNEEARRGGLNVRDVSKDVEAGISCVQELLKQGRLHVHSSCVHLIQEFETYAYPERKPDHNENEAPIKENDHALDEIRYVLYMQEGKGTQVQAHIHYAPSAQPFARIQNLAPELSGAPQDLNKVIPRNAYTYIPKL